VGRRPLARFGPTGRCGVRGLVRLISLIGLIARVGARFGRGPKPSAASSSYREKGGGRSPKGAALATLMPTRHGGRGGLVQ